MSKRQQQQEQQQTSPVSLPYAKQKYWDQRYEKTNNNTNNNKEEEEKTPFDWYFTFDELKPLLTKQLKAVIALSTPTLHAKILEVGCGDRPLLVSLQNDDEYDTQHVDLIGIDFSKNVIQQLKQQQQQQVEETTIAAPQKKKKVSATSATTTGTTATTLQYYEMDARKLDKTIVADNSIDIVIDKGTTDTMLCEKNEFDGFNNVLLLMQEAVRVLKPFDHSYENNNNNNNGLEGSIVLISHIHPTSDQFQRLYYDCILPALYMKPLLLWTIDAHAADVDEEEECEEECEEEEGEQQQEEEKEGEEKEEEEEEKEEEDTGPCVYVIRGRRRRFTRSIINSNNNNNNNNKADYLSPESIVLKFHSYDRSS